MTKEFDGATEKTGAAEELFEVVDVGPAPLTKEERAAIAALQRLAKRWPKSLWLFCGSGPVHVMKVNARGKPAMTPSGGTDQAFRIVGVEIPNDGGDW